MRTYAFRFILLLFFLKITNFKKIIKKIEERSNLTRKTDNILQLIKLLFIIVCVAHLFANIWILLADIEKSNGV
jgi:hypothetical protein